MCVTQGDIPGQDTSKTEISQREKKSLRDPFISYEQSSHLSLDQTTAEESSTQPLQSR